MKSIPFITFLAFLMLLPLLACNKDRIKTTCISFITEHPEFKVTESSFDTLSETVLLKEQYNVGATFETVTEQYLVTEGHTAIKIIDIDYLDVIIDSELDLEGSLPCIKYLSENEFQYTEVPDIYRTRTYQRVAENGTGELMDAEYDTIQHHRLKTDAVVIPNTNTELQQLIKFLNIPYDMDFNEYWEEQLRTNNIIGCGDSTTYKIIY